MNLRIKELVEQAGMELKPRRLWNDNEPNGYLESDDDYLQNNLEATRTFFDGGLERFAELIVWECYAVAKSNMIRPGVEHDLTYNDGVNDCAIMIKQHFGVE